MQDGLHAEDRELRLATPGGGVSEVSALLRKPGDARWLLVLGHGAGAGMRHPFMDRAAAALARHGVATLRYQFPYMEKRAGGRRWPPDRPGVLTATVRAAVERAAGLARGLPLLAGGKSLGGRMTSTAAAERSLPGVQGLVFLGFPLHPAGRPSTGRAEHLLGIELPMLFLQGKRDRLADLSLLRPVVGRLEGASLHEVEAADHSFGVTRSSGRTEDEVLEELARAVETWAGRLGESGRSEGPEVGR